MGGVCGVTGKSGLLHRLRVWFWKRQYRQGSVISRFLAPDIRREVEVVDTSDITSGVLTVRTRTWNVLYAIRGHQPEPAFGAVRSVEIANLWRWSGELWGGPVPSSDE